jgi:hypothetical protein
MTTTTTTTQEQDTPQPGAGTQRVVEVKAIAALGRATVFIQVPYQDGDADSRQRGYNDARTIATAALQAALYAAHEAAEDLAFMDILDAEETQERQAARCAAEERAEEGQRFCCGHEPCQAPDAIRFVEEELKIDLHPWQKQWLTQAMRLQAPAARAAG